MHKSPVHPILEFPHFQLVYEIALVFLAEEYDSLYSHLTTFKYLLQLRRRNPRPSQNFISSFKRKDIIISIIYLILKGR